MFIRHIKLQNWKNFKRAEADLTDRVFVLGPNASGKSNFLDAFRFLRDVATSKLEAAVASRGGLSRLRSIHARNPSEVQIEIVIAEDDGTDRWRYFLSFSQRKQPNQEGVPVVRREIVTDLRSGKSVLTRPDPDDAADEERLTQTALEQTSANKDFREIADFLQTLSYLHILPQVVRDPAGFSPVQIKNDPFGRDFLMRLWTTPARTRDARLKKINEALKIAVPRLGELKVELDERGAPHLVGSIENWRPHMSAQNESQFSDGTLRLLGLLWGMLDEAGPILLEEPELSLNSEVVVQLPPTFERIQRLRKKGRRQIIISTHSNDLLRDKSIAPEEILRLEPSDEGTQIMAADAGDRQLMSAGLTAAEVILPKVSPKSADQLSLVFAR